MIFRMLLLATGLAASALATAAPMLETFNFIRFYGPADPAAVYPCENYDGTACSGSAQAPGTNWTVQYTSSGSASYGVLRDFASSTLNGDDSLGAFSSYSSTGARSGFRDVYTFGGGSGAGVADFVFSVSGTTSQEGGAYASGVFQYVPVVGGAEDWTAAQVFTATIGSPSVVPVDFTFGQPTEFTIFFYALSEIWNWVPGSDATADFTHTAVLSGIDVYDEQNTPVDGFTIASASGTRYTANGVLSEPGSMCLAAIALCLVAVQHTSRRRNPRK